MSPRALEAQAWRKIAKQVAELGLGASGLCFEVTMLVVDDQIKQAMRSRLSEHCGAYEYLDGFIGCDYSYDRKSVRVLYALFLALEAKGGA